MKHGTRPNRIDHRDLDFLKSHRFGAIAPAPFPQEYLTDANIWMPDQTSNSSFNIAGQIVNITAEPEGCTNFCQADIATDLTGVFHNPVDLEAITHANANGGADIRTSLEAARALGWIKAYYNIRPSGAIDAFDAIRLAALSAQPEKRSISWGTPWFPSWENAAQHRFSVMPMPTTAEISAISLNSNAFPWHDSKLGVWKAINGNPMLRDKSWQGYDVGDNGWLYFPRQVVNVVMGIKGTVAYTATLNPVGDPQRIDVNLVQLIVSIVRNLFKL